MASQPIYPLTPYSEIRTEPLITEMSGMRVNKLSVMNWQPNKDTGIEEDTGVGVVSENYLLINNSEVKEVAWEIADKTDFQWNEGRTFWDGKRFMYTLKTNEPVGTVKVGDDVALGLQFWNSYDGSTAFSFRYMLYRLACLNGMTFTDTFHSYRFKHQPKSQNWDQTILDNSKRINESIGDGTLEDVLARMKCMSKTQLYIDDLGLLRKEHLNKLPTNTWGEIIDRFLTEEPDYTAWDMLNAGTNVLWHKEKPTKASLDHNAYVTEGVINAFA